MNEAEKQAECLRICGEAGKRGLHRIAPAICPVQEDLWKKTTPSLGRKDGTTETNKTGS
jgi:hypothetical protein